MSVGHGGKMSKHPPEEKLFILTYIETRLKEVIATLLTAGKIKKTTKLGGVFDPFNTEMDFFVLINTDPKKGYEETWSEYQKVFNGYFTLKAGEAELGLVKKWKTNHNDTLPFQGLPEIFHGSSSKTTLLYSIAQFKMIYGL